MASLLNVAQDDSFAGTYLNHALKRRTAGIARRLPAIIRVSRKRSQRKFDGALPSAGADPAAI